MTAPGGAGRTPLSAEAALSGRDVVPVMNPAAWAMASGRSPSSAASGSASVSVSPGTRPCNISTDSARVSTSTPIGAAISSQPRSREVISTWPLPHFG
jgi:hypothetical protein